MVTFGNKLRNLREDKMLSQIQVYKDTGIHNNTLSGYERGVSQPDLETLVILAKYYDVSTDYLLINKDKTRAEDLTNYICKKSAIDMVSENEAIYELVENILSLSPANQEEIHKLVKLYQIKEEYEKRTNSK